MARKKKKKKKIQPEDLLAERIPTTARDLIRMIHRINPTKEEVDPQKAAHRYRLKASLQSLLIRRFSEGLIVEQPDVNQPQLIGIRLRNFDEDACHAMIHELDEDARSWVQWQIDERHLARLQNSAGLKESASLQNSPKADSPAPGSQPGSPANPMELELSDDELLQLGHKALEEFDYERSEALYRRALRQSEGGLQPALALLEILIEHLAADEKALALSKSFSASTLKDKRVRIRLATAYARLDRIKPALATIRRVVAPEAAQVYYLAAKHFIARQEEEKALNQLASLKACESTEHIFETEQLEKEIRALQARRLEPLEAEMLRSWQAGAVDEASGLAQRLLSVMPENKAARRILRDLKKKARQDQIETLFRRAREARGQQDFDREAECLSRVLAMGEDRPRLKGLLAEAQRKALRQREKAEVDALVSGWADGEREKTLLAYAGLGSTQRERIRAAIQDSHFTWVETVLAAPATVKPLKLTRAVLALGKCMDALHSGDDPQQVITQLGIHEKILQYIPQSREILLQAETRVRTLEEKKKKKLLAEAEAFLAADDLPLTGERIEQLKTLDLDEADQLRLKSLKKRFFHFRKVQTLRKRYEDSVGRMDEVNCRRLAGRLSRLLDDSSTQRWADKMTEHTAAIRRQWRLSTAEIFDLPGCYGSLGLNPDSDRGSCLLLPGSRKVLIATAHDRWVFLRTFDLKDRQFHRGYLLQAPRPLDSVQAAIDGGTVWINDLQGQVFQVGLDPFDILFSRDFGTLIAGHEEYEEVLLCPQSRLLWLKKAGLTKNQDDVFEIISIDRGRSSRRIKSTGFPERIYAGGEYRIVLQDLLAGPVRIYTGAGKVLEAFTLQTAGAMHHAAVHPNGKDFVFLPFDDTGALAPAIEPQIQGDLNLVLEVKPDPEKKYKPIKIFNSNGEATHGIATSLDHGVVFVHFFQDSDEQPGRRLAAWKPSEKGFQLVFNLQAPENLILARDESSRQVAAVAFRDFRFEACLLDEKPPEFQTAPDDSLGALPIPPFEAHWICSIPTGRINAASLAFMMQLRNADFKDQRRIMREMREKAPADDIAALAYALERLLRLEEAGAFKQLMREKFPDYPLVRIELANEASEKSAWVRVIDLLQGLPRDGLDEGSARHLCHLLGMGHFALGEVQKALDTWKEGLAYEGGRCELEPYIDYAETALWSPESRKRRMTANAAAKMLSIYEQVDRHLAKGQWEQAIAALESMSPLTDNERLILARLAHAYLQVDRTPGEMKWVCKVIALAHFLDSFKASYRKDPVLPPCVEKWPESRLAEVAGKAESWLANYAVSVGNTPAPTEEAPPTRPLRGPKNFP